MEKALLVFGLLFSACASRPMVLFSSIPDPVAFLNARHAIGEASCTLAHGAERREYRCVVYEGESKQLMYVAVYTPKDGVLRAIKRLYADGRQTDLWARPGDYTDASLDA